MLLIFLQILYKIEILLCYSKNLNRNSAKLFSLKMECKEGDRAADQKSISKPIKELCSAHRQLCNLIETANDAHGLQIVLLFCTIVMFSLSCLYFETVKPISEVVGTAKIENLFALENLITLENVIGVLSQCVRYLDLNNKSVC